MAARACRMDLAEVSDVAVLKRLRHASAWLGHLLDQWFRSPGIDATITSRFRLVLTDGSTIQRPGSTGTPWRLHAQWNLGTGQWVGAWGTTGRRSRPNLWETLSHRNLFQRGEKPPRHPREYQGRSYEGCIAHVRRPMKIKFQYAKEKMERMSNIFVTSDREAFGDRHPRHRRME